MGYTEEAAIRTIMERQTTDQVFELAHWENGVFIYDEPEQMPHFTVRIQGELRVFALDAYRRIDEGQTARKVRKKVDNEVCYACPTVPWTAASAFGRSTSSPTTACGASWRPSSTSSMNCCATRGTSTVRRTRTRRSILDASLDVE